MKPSSPLSSSDVDARPGRPRHRRLQRRPVGHCPHRALRADHRRPACVRVLPDRRRAALRSPSPWLGRGPDRKLDAKIAAVEVVHSGDELVAIYAQLRAECARVGHALSQREHDADRWIAATALRLGIPLVSNDRVFEGAPGLRLESAHR
ncbi:MAG: PIN domain-containing protein [Acidimicrobiales bacterium]